MVSGVGSKHESVASCAFCCRSFVSVSIGGPSPLLPSPLPSSLSCGSLWPPLLPLRLLLRPHGFFHCGEAEFLACPSYRPRRLGLKVALPAAAAAARSDLGMSFDLLKSDLRHSWLPHLSMPGSVCTVGLFFEGSRKRMHIASGRPVDVIAVRIHMTVSPCLRLRRIK
ncbi:hypothetical protein GW17_00036514 [Ensete ventricosum]|nr:hypothetical protein GW17_00036514 [Ensete ventricosum]